MINPIRNQDGLTVVELLVALVIAGLIASAIGSYLVIHVNSFEIAQDIVDIQYEAQIGLNNLSEVIMESRGLYAMEDHFNHEYEVQGDGSVVHNLLDPSEAYMEDVYVIAFEGLNGYEVFIKETDSYDLMYYNTSNSAILDNISLYLPNAEIFATHIERMDVYAAQDSFTTATSGALMLTFEETKGLEIILHLAKNDRAEMTVRTISKYRNMIPD